MYSSQVCLCRLPIAEFAETAEGSTVSCAHLLYTVIDHMDTDGVKNDDGNQAGAVGQGQGAVEGGSGEGSVLHELVGFCVRLLWGIIWEKITFMGLCDAERRACGWCRRCDWRKEEGVGNYNCHGSDNHVEAKDEHEE